MGYRGIAWGLVLLAISTSGLPRDFVIEDGDVAGLRAAVRSANASDEPDRIFLPPQGRYSFVDRAAGEATALPPVVGRLDIVGNDSVLRRYSEQPFAHLAVAAGAQLRLVDLTLADGGAGALVNDGELLAWGVTIEDSSSSTGASALLNRGEARLVACGIRFNSYAGAESTGGAIVNFGVLRLLDSVIHGNTAFGGQGAVEFGAALSNHGQATLTGVTVSANGAAMTLGSSGAIANFEGGALEIRDSVIIDNEPASLAAVRTGGIVDLSGTRIQR